MQANAKHDFTFFAKLFLAIGILVFVACCWNYCYQSYLLQSGYKGDIFRPGLKETLQPFYILPETNAGHTWAVYVVGAIALALFGLYVFVEVSLKRKYAILSVVYLLLVLVFADSENDARLCGINSHYQTFANDLHLFSGLRDLLANYTSRQHLMDVHGQHYPPLNLVLLMFSQKLGWLPLAKGFSILSGLACILICQKINPKSILTPLLALSPGMLIFPSLDFVPIPALLGLCSFLVFKKALRLGKIKWWVRLGILLAFFSLFSYSVSVLILFFGVWFLVQKISIRVHFKGILLASVTCLLGFGMVWLFTGFNQYDCFMQSISNNSELLQSNGFDNFLRYFIRSTGNLLGIFFSGGLLVFFLVVSRLTLETKTWIITLIIASFSGLFFGETERIWLFLLPLCILADNVIPPTKISRYLLVSFALTIAIWQELTYKHFL